MNKFFSTIRKRLVMTCLSASLLISSAAAAMPEIIALDGLRPGMWGTGYTVIDSSGEIRPFDVEVVGVLGDKGKTSSRRILVNLYGDVIEQTGGAISGMSGSPIYFDGKLAGALSAGYRDMYPSQRIMLTPIEDMLKIWAYADTRNQSRFPQLDLKKMQEEREKFQAKQAEKAAAEDSSTDEAAAEEAAEPAEEAAAPDEEAAESAEEAAAPDEEASEPAGEAAVPDEEAAEPAEEATVPDEEASEPAEEAAAPAEEAAESAEEEAAPAESIEPKSVYFASGFGSAGMKLLQQGMEKLGIDISYDNTWDNGASVMAARPDAVLYPGSPVGVALSLGDFTIGSMGTVTAVDGKRVLAFGHPYTHRGNVNYFMTDAQVVSTTHGPTAGMKLGNVSSIIGRINQDRRDGVGGILGQMPQTMPVIVSVHDKDTGRAATYNTMIAYDEEVIGVLAPVVVYSSVANMLDRQDGSTADIKFALRSNYGKNGLLERRNMFYDAADVAQGSVSELTNVLGVILGNKEKEPDLLDLKVDVTVERGRRTASLVSAKPSKKEALPGEAISFETTIKPYRGEKIKVSVPYTIPKNQVPGDLELDVHGGGMVNVAKLILAQQAAAEEGKNMEEEPPVDVRLQDMLSANCNNEIVIESTVVVPKNEAELKESIRQAQKMSEKLAQQAKKDKAAGAAETRKKAPVNKTATDYIIENIIHTSVKVLEKK
ncbi:MAG: SpoIVB peptidase S55 domain-containing protein [Anaerovibrio sp.]|nr:SpoIVB peptidase S55 domain-containing protein [Anaerovibrio sp.]